MKRRQFLTALGAAAAAATIAKPAIAQSMPTIKWRLTASWPKSLDTIYGACETFAKYVSEATDNKFQVQVFAAGEIVPALQTLDAVQNGTVEAGHTATYYYIGKDPTWALFCATPFGLNARQQNAWYYDGEGTKLLDDFGKKFNTHNLLMGNTGAQMGGWFNREITEPETSKVSRCALAAGPARRWRSSASSRSRSPAATSTRRWRRASSTPPNGSAPTTTRSSASTKS